MHSFPYLEPVCCSMSSSNCCFLTCIQVSQEAGQVVCYSHLLKNFLQFIAIHTVKGFGIVNKAEIDVFLEHSHFFMIQRILAIWFLVPLPFLKPAWTLLGDCKLSNSVILELPIRVARIPNTNTTKCWQESRATGALIYCWWECCMFLWNSLSFLINFSWV